MAEATQGFSSARDEYLRHILEVMRENDEFLRNNAREVLDEAVELVNDAIDLVGLAVKKEHAREDYVSSAIVFFLYHVLMPFSYAIHADALTGNLPACFMELRLMVESLAKCYLADSMYSDSTFFQERLELLEVEHPSTSQVMKQLQAQLALDDDFIRLWGKLSGHWIHTKGVMNRIVDQLMDKSEVPAWALVIPMTYADSDLHALDELRKRVSQFRHLLTVTMGEY